jgi:hypothetical protein
MSRSVLIGTAIILLAVVSLPDLRSAEDDGRLVINEVMYDPTGDELDGEWIEILVVEGDTSTGGWTLTDLDGHL